MILQSCILKLLYHLGKFSSGILSAVTESLQPFKYHSLVKKFHLIASQKEIAVKIWVSICKFI